MPNLLFLDIFLKVCYANLSICFIISIMLAPWERPTAKTSVKPLRT